MKNLVVISHDPRFAEALGIGLDASAYRVRAFADLASAVESAAGAAVDFVILDGGRAGADLACRVADARGGFAGARVVAVADNRDDAWQEEVLRAGASQVFSNGLNASMLAAWLDNQPAATIAEPAPAPAAVETMGAPMLEAIGELSRLLAETLDPEALAREFMLHVRRLLGVNRSLLFLRDAERTERLQCAFSAGRPVEAFAGYELSLLSGIGRRMASEGRVIRREGSDEETRRTLADLGVEVAIPVLDRQSLLGIAFLDRKVSGSGFSERELALLFHVFEAFGLALRNARAHTDTERREELSSGVFDSLRSGCLLVGPGREILHANPALREMFDLRDEFALTDLPAVIASRAFAALKGEGSIEDFTYETGGADGRILEVSLKRVPHPHDQAGRALLVVINEVTERERARRAEAEAARTGLIRSMAEHLAHEIGNTLVPLSTGQQLMAAGTADAETQKGLETVFADSVKRIARLTGQMQFLSREGLRRMDEVPARELLAEAFQEAVTRLPGHSASLELKGLDEELTLCGEKAGLKQVFSEILLNALQASPEDQRVEVQCRPVRRDEADWLEIEVLDHGPGFEGEPLRRAKDPFYSGRKVGMGLGLTVAERIVQLHGGRLELRGPGGGVLVQLPRRPAVPVATGA